MLEIKNIITIKNYSLNINNNNIINNLNANFLKNNSYVIIGENGVGKSTLLQNILSTQSSNKNNNIICNNNFNPLLYQDIASIYNPLIKINTQAFLTSNNEIKNLAVEYLLKDLFKDIINKKPLDVSLGTLQKIALIDILSINKLTSLTNPLILLDEPSAFLDNNSKQSLVYLLKHLQNNYNFQYIITSHNIGFINLLNDNLNNLQLLNFIKPNNSFLVPFTLINNNNNVVIANKKNNNKNILTVSNLSISYNKKSVINKLSFNVNAGSIVAIYGENGSGKSTLLNYLYKSFKQQNKLKKINNDITFNDLSNINDVAILYQNYSQMLPKDKKIKTIFLDIITTNNKNRKNINTTKLHKYKTIITFLRTFNFTSKISSILNKNFNNFSLGEQQKIALISILLLQPKLIIMDEPNSSLSYKNSLNLVEILKKLNTQQNITFIISLQEIDSFSKIIDQKINL